MKITFDTERITICGASVRYNSFYFSYEKGKELELNIRHILRRWLQKLPMIMDGQELILPFNYDDGVAECFSFKRNKDRLTRRRVDLDDNVLKDDWQDLGATSGERLCRIEKEYEFPFEEYDFEEFVEALREAMG